MCFWSNESLYIIISIMKNEMLFEWNKDTARWDQNANTYTRFFDKIGAMIGEKVNGFDTLADFGCGIGLIDLILSSYVTTLTGVDVSKFALAQLEENAKKAGLTNIHTILCDVDEVKKSFDVIITSFFGSRDIPRFLPQCKIFFAIIGYASEEALFPPKAGKNKRNTVGDAIKQLKESGINFKLTEASLPFGQPFESVVDAENFVGAYCPELGPSQIKNFLTERLRETDNLRFPLYIPRTKRIGIFEIRGGL